MFVLFCSLGVQSQARHASRPVRLAMILAIEGSSYIEFLNGLSFMPSSSVRSEQGELRLFAKNFHKN
jgi:hypothetical protein